jgi:hypothetical protein
MMIMKSSSGCCRSVISCLFFIILVISNFAKPISPNITTSFSIGSTNLMVAAQSPSERSERLWLPRMITTSSCEMPQAEITALQDLYNSTTGEDWSWTGVRWNFTESAVNPCEQHWQGVNCTYSTAQQCHVSSLVLIDNRMNGTLPSSLDLLINLAILSIQNNFLLKGSIPKSLCHMNDITELILANNSLHGSIPSCLQQVNMQYLDLSYNQLRGLIPSSLCNMTKLISLELNNNQLTGMMRYSRERERQRERENL